ncbi:hypothetical protein CCYA_CCYA14G3787 [Cyanidiococcus yangmingshanensis]|nr:hypothetical protein CCYA_CCYA14G3787 [Cyanidiococcus yangmingshanensis]
MSSDGHGFGCNKSKETRKQKLANKDECRFLENLERRSADSLGDTAKRTRDDHVSSCPQRERNRSFLSRMRSLLHVGSRTCKNTEHDSKTARSCSCGRKKPAQLSPSAENNAPSIVSLDMSTETFADAKGTQKRYVPYLDTINEGRSVDCKPAATDESPAVEAFPQAQILPESNVGGDDIFARSHCMRLIDSQGNKTANMGAASSEKAHHLAETAKIGKLSCQSEPAKKEAKSMDGTSFLLPSQKEIHKNLKTLVLDLDETLVHSGFDLIDNPDYVVQIDVNGIQRTLYVKKRPGCDRFLREMADYFEIVVFTASLPKYADMVCDLLNQSVGRDVIAHRLFRDSCEFDVDALCFVKNLHKLGRDIKNTVIVDNSPSAYLKNVENAIPVVSWFSDEEDHTLEDLIPLLREIANAHDVQEAIAKSPVVQKLRESLTSCGGACDETDQS